MSLYVARRVGGGLDHGHLVLGRQVSDRLVFGAVGGQLGLRRGRIVRAGVDLDLLFGEIFLLGAEVTQAYTRHLGVPVRPSWHAQFVTTTAADQPPALPRRVVSAAVSKQNHRGKSKRSGR